MNFLLETNYGAQIFNERDRHLIESILRDFVSADVINQNQLALIQKPARPDSNRHIVPDIRNRNKVLEFIDKLPESIEPEAFGLNDIAEFSRQSSTSALLQTRVAIIGSQHGSATRFALEIDYSRLATLIKELIRTLPMPIETIVLAKKFPLASGDPLTFVIHQEIELINNLIANIKRQLEDAVKVCTGHLHASNAMHQAISLIDLGEVPPCWRTLGKIHAKSIPSFMTKLSQRIKQVNTWITQGAVTSCWLSSLFKPESFLLAILLSEAKKRGVPAEQLDFYFEASSQESSIDKSTDGEIHLNGLVMQNAQIEFSSGQIVDSSPKRPFAGNIRLNMTVRSREAMPVNGTFYSCPLYKSIPVTSSQKTGSPRELLCSVKLPSSQSPKKWLKNGVALFTQIEDA